VDAVAHSSHGEALYATGLRTMVMLPLFARGKRLGTFTLVSTDPSRYSPADVAFVEEVARRAALTIDNAQLYERARAAIHAREDLLAIVSHDLRNPLSVIIMLLSSMTGESSREVETDRDRPQLEAMKRATDRMTRLLADLLDSASMNAGHFSVETDRVAVAPLVATALDMARPLAARGGLSLVSELHGDLPAVRADASRIQQVLANLIGNAIKFTERSGKITVSAYRSGGGETGNTVTFAVKDTGPGIAEADRSHLFDRFWQAQPTARMGTGLGLFIAKAIVESHGGTIWLESTVGMGSTFLFQLPVVKGTSSP
jgi:signal transduction histidine kinase